jgi:hypothetical protein
MVSKILKTAGVALCALFVNAAHADVRGCIAAIDTSQLEALRMANYEYHTYNSYAPAYADWYVQKAYDCGWNPTEVVRQSYVYSLRAWLQGFGGYYASSPMPAANILSAVPLEPVAQRIDPSRAVAEAMLACIQRLDMAFLVDLRSRSLGGSDVTGIAPMYADQYLRQLDACGWRPTVVERSQYRVHLVSWANGGPQ